jgi:hypothetical protein
MASTGTYQINDVSLFIQPTSGQWIDRKVINIDGNGHPVYPPYREFEMKWQLVDMEQVDQLMDYFNLIGRTGTVSVNLPWYAHNPYYFHTYSGTVLQEPILGRFFSEHQMDVTLLITKIRIS